MHESNKESYVLVNTPYGQTNRTTFKDIEMQGSVLSPIKAAVHMDRIGQSMMEMTSNKYFYKKLVGIPAIEMIDCMCSKMWNQFFNG